MLNAEIPSNFKKLNVNELKTELRSLGLRTKGKKGELQKRLMSHYKGTQHSDEQVCIEPVIDEPDLNLDVPVQQESERTRLSISIEESQQASIESLYVPAHDFSVLVEDFMDFKKYVFERIERNEESREKDKVTINELKEENKLLKQELRNKQLLIDKLVKQTTDRQILPTKMQYNFNTWETVKENPKFPKPIQPNVNYSIPANPNRFEHLQHYESNHDVLYNGIEPRNTISKEKEKSNRKRNGFPIDEKPENDHWRSQQQKYPKIVPGNSSYANMTRRGKKINVFGDSILRHMKGKAITEELKSGRVYVKAFPGANCNQLSHYITPNLTEQNPDAVIIHVGTNDLKIRQGQQKSNEAIANDIINIGKQCKQHGVNDVFISGITYRKGFHLMKKVHEVNDIVQNLCLLEDLHFISNNNIREQHLWQDGIHLSESGVTVLSNNMINSLNANL